MLIVQLLVSAVVAGSVYALVGLAFVLIYRGTRIVHFGLGDQLTLGAYIVVILQVFLGFSFAAAIAGALLLSAGVGMLIDRFILRPISHYDAVIPIIATLAVGLVIREGIRAFMGPNAWAFPFLLPPDPIQIDGIFFAWSNLAILVVALLVLGLLYALFTFSRLGKAIIAACENRVGAFLVGVPVPWMVSFIWCIASVLAAIAGILIAPIVTLTPDMGWIAIKGFAAAVLGGFTSLPGAVLAGFGIGVLETIAGTYISTAMKDAITYIVMIAFIIARPQGILGALRVKKV